MGEKYKKGILGRKEGSVPLPWGPEIPKHGPGQEKRGGGRRVEERVEPFGP